MKTHPSQPNAPDSVAAEVTRLKSSNKQRLLTSSATKLPLAPHSPRQSPNCGFTRTDLGVVLAVVGLLAVLATSVLGKIQPAAHRAGCANNLRQMGVAIMKFSSENRNIPPWFVPPADGGTGGRGLVYQHFLVFSNYVDSPRIMVCPGDEAKQPAVDFSSNTNGLMGMGNLAAGYVIMTELSMEMPLTLFMGDRKIGGGDPNNYTCRGGSFISIPFNFPSVPVKRFRPYIEPKPYWMPELHGAATGNLLHGDGRVRSTDSEGLNKAYADNPTDPNKSACTMVP